MPRLLGALVLLATLTLAASAPTVAQRHQPYAPPRHTEAAPILNLPPEVATRYADGGAQIERDRTPTDDLAELRRMDRALAGLALPRKGVIDTYVVAVGLDSDPVFGREAREAAKVLAWRYGAAGRTIVLAGSDGAAPSDLPRGSPEHINIALARIAELIDPTEDVVILYTTSHGAQLGIVYNDGDQGFGVISPDRLATTFDRLGIKRRLVIISACYSGVFVPALRSPDSAVLTASADDRSSFGCQSDNDWTFYGDALINRAMRRVQSLQSAVADAGAQVAAWEVQNRLLPSRPQSAIGSRAGAWLELLEARMPKTETAPVGRPATALFDRR